MFCCIEEVADYHFPWRCLCFLLSFWILSLYFTKIQHRRAARKIAQCCKVTWVVLYLLIGRIASVVFVFCFCVVHM